MEYLIYYCIISYILVFASASYHNKWEDADYVMIALAPLLLPFMFYFFFKSLCTPDNENNS
jgi:hypothetical protein